jgi:hypothetical protein
MLDEALEALAASASSALIQAMTTDAWGSFRNQMVIALSGGATGRQQRYATLLDKTKIKLAASQLSTESATEIWQSRLEDLFETNPDVAAAIRILIGAANDGTPPITSLSQRASAGHGSTINQAGRDIDLSSRRTSYGGPMTVAGVIAVILLGGWGLRTVIHNYKSNNSPAVHGIPSMSRENPSKSAHSRPPSSPSEALLEPADLDREFPNVSAFGKYYNYFATRRDVVASDSRIGLRAQDPVVWFGQDGIGRDRQVSPSACATELGLTAPWPGGDEDGIEIQQGMDLSVKDAPAVLTEAIWKLPTHSAAAQAADKWKSNLDSCSNLSEDSDEYTAHLTSIPDLPAVTEAIIISGTPSEHLGRAYRFLAVRGDLVCWFEIDLVDTQSQSSRPELEIVKKAAALVLGHLQGS